MAGINLDHWVDGAWADPSFSQSAWGEEEEAGIGLAPVLRAPPVDIVISASWRRQYLPFRESLHERTLETMARLRAIKREKAELREMIETYERT